MSDKKRLGPRDIGAIIFVVAAFALIAGILLQNFLGTD
jgi:hypothetical protein